MSYGHIDFRGVQSSRELQSPLVLGVDPDLSVLRHGQQGGLALGVAVVQVEARCDTEHLLSETRELQ